MLNLNINTLSSLRTGSIAPAPLLATVTTASVSNITATGATGGGTISGGTGSVVTEAGVCWSLTPTPTTSSDKATTGATSGSFTVNLTGLTGSTGYYARAYAINAAGTAYGNEVTFNTPAPGLQIGQDYQGGKIAYLSSPTSGLIITGGEGGIWSNDNVFVSTQDSIGSGNQNSINIKNSSGGNVFGSAARYCIDGTYNGYSYWYLTSLDEIAQVYTNRVALGIASSGRYWCSSQHPSSGTLYAYAYDFSGGYGAQQDKQDTLAFFAMRSF